MRYDEFRDQFQDALRDVGLFQQCIGNPIETIELSDTGRHWKAYISRDLPPNTEPFHVTAEIAFDWSPFDAARSYTCEEDLLTELVGRKKRPSKTEPRLTRVDLELHASLPYGSTTSYRTRRFSVPGPNSLARNSIHCSPNIKSARGSSLPFSEIGGSRSQSPLRCRRYALPQGGVRQRIPSCSGATSVG